MATPSATPVAYVELAPHSLQIAVVSGRRLLALHAFALDARADIGAFVAEHGLAGVVRATLLGAHGFLHLSDEAEAGAIRQPAAIQGHAVRMSHRFAGAPFAAVVDAATGLAPDPTRGTPWLLTAVDAAAASSARETLGAFGLAPVDLTLAAPSHLGVVASSLNPGETALVLLTGEEHSQLAWVDATGVRSVVESPVGFATIFAGVQQGLGLKFKAAAGKLFYNANYDFSDSAPKIGAVVAAQLKSVLEANPATHLHVTGLLPCQAWLVEELAKNLAVKIWTPTSAVVATRLGLDLGSVPVWSGAVPLLPVLAAGSSDAAWVQSSLENMISRSRASATMVAKPAPAASATVAVPAPAVIAEPPAPAPALVEDVRVTSVTKTEEPAASAPARKHKSGPVLIAATVGVVAAVVGIAAYFRSPPRRDDPKPAVPPAMAPTTPVAPAPSETPAAKPAPAPTPTPAPAPAPAPVKPAPVVEAAPVAPTTGASADLAAGEPRRFRNERYRFEVSDKGFIQAVASARDEVLVESAAGVSLQGSYVGTDGRRKWFNVGGVDDAAYQATVQKAVEGGVTVFTVKVTHPRFELDQTFRCLPGAIKVSATFTPVNLRDPRGSISAVHSVRLSPIALDPGARMRPSADSFAYTLKSGALGVSFDNGAWARDGADGRQPVVAGENGVAFHFTDTPELARRTLNYELSLP